MVAVDDIAWTSPVSVTEIPERGLRVSIDAGEAERAAIARLAGLRDLAKLNGTFELTAAPHGAVRVEGVISADVTQSCVVTLEAVENQVVEPVDLVFAPSLPSQTVPKELPDEDQAEPPDPLINGTIDLAKIATEHLILGLDPYPRKPGVVFEPIQTPDDPEDHPFAGLAALKQGQSEPRPAKRGKKKPL